MIDADVMEMGWGLKAKCGGLSTPLRMVRPSAAPVVMTHLRAGSERGEVERSEGMVPATFLNLRHRIA